MAARKNVLLWPLVLASTFCLNSIGVCAQGSTLKTGLLKITKPTPRTLYNGSATRVATAATSTTPPPSSSTTEITDSSTSATIPEICIHGLRVMPTDMDQAQNVRYERDFVHIIEGDAMLSILTTDVASVLFVVNRINRANLLDADFEIASENPLIFTGVRAILIEDETIAENLLMQEVQYLQQCITHAIGIFVDHDVYKSSEQIIKDLEYNIWPILSPHVYLFPKVAHLLHQMPWGESIASVEILTENLATYNEFMEAIRHEQMCLMHFKSDKNVYILFGNKMAHHFEENGTIFAVPTDRAYRTFISDLPDKSYILMEREIDADAIDGNSTLSTLDETFKGKSVQPSRVFAFARPMLELVRWLKGSLMRNCKREQNIFIFESCFNFLTFIADWQTPEYRQYYEPAKILELLHMHRFASLMNFQMYQKVSENGHGTATISSGEDHIELREIASQNFVTNITTFYHYNRANSTSLELKPKFGQVFNCQYSAGENARYPFLFDGESVMFWRIKPDAWVATGMTAAILGLIITLAILVFIVVRISLGDVFEGNPVTSILLLLSLILLFTSFVPFSLEYIGEHRNSHVTFEDAATLNTLCAVRVFIMTLVYCFTFSLLLCRAVMLASIGSEGGFLSHVNGYIQAVICILSIFVQLGMSIQLLVIMHVATESISCENMYYGHWLWVLVAYDFILLVGVVALVPFIYRSQRNYREGILIVIGAVLTFLIWIVWIGMSFFGDEIRDAAIPLGLQATGWAILVGVLIPRTFLIVRGIERSDIAQALPSLTSLAFAQNNQYSSEQSVYECVNPAMRSCSQAEMAQSPSEIPTLPLRGGGPRRQQFFANLRQANANINPQRPPSRPQRGSPTRSECSSLPDSPESSKITRF
ncbi:protein bride of sevenless-like [Rhagoletis pomonella]|uniref:protein bride of sevenless-like n=2 Tax=Rhagoletis pomonella TaxID=28610 RepID=UPI00177D7F85|nr:protein bride of sevenless-like [Rhagoletis pomonella]